MKISKLFHWLYFMVMMLPLFVVPIYFIYSQRHDLTEQTQVDIQYKYQSNEVNSYSDLVEGNIYYLNELDITQDYYDFDSSLVYFQILSFDNYDGDFSIVNYDYDLESLPLGYTRFTCRFDGGNGIWFYFGDAKNVSSWYYLDDGAMVLTDVIFVLDYGVNLSVFNDYYLAAYGDNFLPQYTDFNIIESVQVEDTNTSITNAFVNSFADTIDKYFNYDNVFNFGDLYTWLNTNFFSGNAPLGFFIFWHLLIYWLLTSLLWLLFDVLMYVPNLVHRWLDKASLS